MLAVIAINCFGHGVDRFVAKESSLRDNLVRYAINAVKAASDVDSVLVATHDATLVDQARNLFGVDGAFLMKSLSEAGNVAKDVAEQIPEDYRGQDCLVLAPTVGPVSEGRITSLFEYVAEGGEEIALAGIANPIDINCNPVWLKCLEGELDNVGNETGVTGDITPAQPCFSDEKGGAMSFPLPKGSQWLPELYHYDGAVTFLRGGKISATWHYQLASREEELPMVYQLPIFQLHQSIDWEIPSPKIEGEKLVEEGSETFSRHRPSSGKPDVRAATP